MTTSIRVLIGDDHRIVREGLKQVLADAADITVVAEATSGPDVLHQLEQLRARNAQLSEQIQRLLQPGTRPGGLRK